MMFRAVFWVVLPCKMMMMEAVRTSETSVDNHFTQQYNPEDSSEHVHSIVCYIRGRVHSRLRSHIFEAQYL
jgi:hypothetical protein